MDQLSRLWSDPAATGLALGISIGFFALGLLAVPIVIARLPADYFVRPPRQDDASRHRFLRIARRVLQNLIGGFLLLAGIAMLVLPGQGVLAILAALSLLEFPGKRRVQRRLLGLPGVERVVNAIRRRAGSPPLVLRAERLPDFKRDRSDSTAS